MADIVGAIAAVLAFLYMIFFGQKTIKELMRRPPKTKEHDKFQDFDILLLRETSTKKIADILQNKNSNFFQKYISKIYYDREKAREKFDSFINQNEKRCCIISGKAGKGKTTFLCNLAESFHETSYKGNKISVLINGSELKLQNTTLREYIAKYFDTQTYRSTFKKLAQTLKDNGSELIVFIDAINELEGEDSFELFNEQMNDLLSSIEKEILPFKFCLSCRTDFWNQFNTKDWVANNIFDPRGGLTEEPTYELENFDENQIDEVIERYFKWYALAGKIIGNARDTCRDPIMLRYFCAAYTNRRSDDPPEKSITVVNIGTVEILQRKKVFDEFVANIRKRMYNNVKRKLNLPNPTKKLLYDFTTRYLIHLAKQMLESERAFITPEEVHTIAKGLKHPDSDLDKYAFFEDSRSIFFMFVDEGIILDKRRERQYDFVFETYFEYSLGRYIALERWTKLLPDGAIDSLDSPYRINPELIEKDFKLLLNHHNFLLRERNFTNLLGALHYAILVTEDDERYKDHPFLFIDLLEVMLNAEQFIYRQKALETIRESELATGIAKNKNPSQYEVKLSRVFTILDKLTETVDFVILWDLENTINKIAQINLDIVIEEMKEWAEKEKEIKAMFAAQTFNRICNLDYDKVIDVLVSLSNRKDYKTNFWLARSLIFTAVELGKNAIAEELSKENLTKLRQMVESFLEDECVINVIKGMALAALPYLSECNEKRLERICNWVNKSTDYIWGIWNLAYELREWHQYGPCDERSWIWKILNRIIDINNQHLNYAVYKSALILRKYNQLKADEIILDRIFNSRWRPEEFHGYYDQSKSHLTGIVYSPVYLEPSFKNHIECRERLQTILEKLIIIGEENFNWVDPIKADETVLRLVHNERYDRHRDGSSWKNYLTEVKRASEMLEQKSSIDFANTGPSELRYESYDVALVSVGGVLSAIDYVMNAPAFSAWSMGRPPGHLANNMICILNNIAVGAYYTIKKYKMKRILIVDCDAHHGKHTAWVFRENPDVIYFSMHIEGDYAKEEGKVEHTGKGRGEGYNFNLQYPANMDDDGYKYMIDNLLIPMAIEFKPELIMISAGFDGHFEDYLTPPCILSESAYIHLAKGLRKLAKELNVKVVGAFEGGYGLQSMANSLVHMINIIGEWGIPEERIGFIEKPDQLYVDLRAISKTKKEVQNRVKLMQKRREEDSTYMLFSDLDHWRKILNEQFKAEEV